MKSMVFAALVIGSNAFGSSGWMADHPEFVNSLAPGACTISVVTVVTSLQLDGVQVFGYGTGSYKGTNIGGLKSDLKTLSEAGVCVSITDNRPEKID